MRQEKGFTLLEVLIGAVLIFVGVGSMGITVMAVKRSLKESENRAQAMRVAARKIDEFLGKAYSEVEVQEEYFYKGYDGFDYSYKVSLETASAADGSLRIPYKKAEAVAFYTADKGSGGIHSIRNVRLSNIIAYPLVHLTAVKLTADKNAKVPWAETKVSEDYAKECLSGGCDCYASCLSTETDCERCAPFTTDKVVGSAAGYLELSGLRYNVDKTMEVTYTIALNVEDTANEIGTVDTVFTACFLDEVQHGLVTRTPLLTQPSFSNKIVLSKDWVEKDTSHTVHIRWYYNANETGEFPQGKAYTAAHISLRQAGLSVLAVE